MCSGGSCGQRHLERVSLHYLGLDGEGQHRASRFGDVDTNGAVRDPRGSLKKGNVMENKRKPHINCDIV